MSWSASINIPLSSQEILRHSSHDSGGELAPILKTIQRLKRLNELLIQIFPKEMSKHCQIANLTQGKLILTFDNAIWASKFYFEKNEFLSKFRAIPEFAGISQIQHHVNPDLFKAPPKPPLKPREFKLSPGAEDSLNQLILSSQGKLQEKLKKLHARLSLPD